MSTTAAPSRALSILLLGPMFVSTILAFLGVVGIMVFFVPKFQAIATEFNLTLSPVQTAFYRTAEAVRGSNGGTGLWIFIVPLIFILAVPIGLMTIAPGTRTLGRFIVLIMFLIAISLVLLTVYSCYSPLIAVIENLASDPKNAL